VAVSLEMVTTTVIAGPDLVTRGFVYVRESEELIEEAKERVKEALQTCEERGTSEWSVIKSVVRDSLSKYLYEKTKRRPMILPIIMEV
jgi:ribonuclease J